MVINYDICVDCELPHPASRFVFAPVFDENGNNIVPSAKLCRQCAMTYLSLALSGSYAVLKFGWGVCLSCGSESAICAGTDHGVFECPSCKKQSLQWDSEQ